MIAVHMINEFLYFQIHSRKVVKSQIWWHFYFCSCQLNVVIRWCHFLWFIVLKYKKNQDLAFEIVVENQLFIRKLCFSQIKMKFLDLKDIVSSINFLLPTQKTETMSMCAGGSVSMCAGVSVLFTIKKQLILCAI